MKHLAPAYYGAFTCLADRCRDNCCIGWEIGIDPDTAAFYDSFPGETGDWLRSGITPPGTDRCFLPDSQGRCRFLNEKKPLYCLSPGGGTGHGGNLPGTPPLP